MKHRRYLRSSALSASALAGLFVPGCSGQAPSVPMRTTLSVPSTTTTEETSTTCPTSYGSGNGGTGGPLTSTTVRLRPRLQLVTVRTCPPIAVVGRPLRRRFGLLAPTGVGAEDAGLEFASVVAFAELSMRLVSVGAPSELVARCHLAALDEIRHAELTDRLAGRSDVRREIRGLRGRRISSPLRSRSREIAAIALESYVDGWLNESAAAAELRVRAANARDDHAAAYEQMAADEDGHAELARDVVLWCASEAPEAVGRRLRRLVPAA
jgi:hypothetical protein